MRTLLFLLTVFASLAFAQKTPASRDAGVTTAKVAADAGVAVAPAPPPPSPDVEKLKKEVLELRTRLIEVEKAQQSRADSLERDVERLGKKLEELKSQFKDVSAAEERRSDAEQAVATRKAQTAQAATTLNSVLQQLGSGTTSGIDASLRYAESVYTGNAQRDVQLARAALQQGDLTAVRGYLMLALFEAETAQR